MIRAAALRELVQQQTGMHLPAATVARAARNRVSMLGNVQRGAYLARVEQDPDELAALIELLVVPETWLFRDPEAFAAASTFAVARHRTVRRRLKILSLPCATGEEPYSLAMALLDAGMDGTQFNIDGIDISTVALERARAATYGRNAFRNADNRFRDRYFTPGEHGHCLLPAVQALVRFRHGNLFDLDAGVATLGYDIIFCRNLLIYFEEPMQQRALTILDRLLDDQGMLFSGYAEFPVFVRHGFVSAQLHGAFAVRKAACAPAAVLPTVPRRTGAQTETQFQPPCTSAVRSVGMKRPADRTPPASGTVTQARSDDPVAQARSLANRGALDAAMAQLQVCLARWPELASAHALLGTIHARLGHAAAAGTCLRHALYLEPNDYEVLCQLALLADQRGDPDRAAGLRARAARVLGRKARS